MRALIASFVFLIVVVLAFISGAFSASGGLMIVGFCGLPFAMFALGWAAKGAMAGKRFAILSLDDAPPQRLQIPDDRRTERPMRSARPVDRQV